MDIGGTVGPSRSAGLCLVWQREASRSGFANTTSSDVVGAILDETAGRAVLLDGEPDDLGKLEALAGVRQIPIRVKCATLAWHTLKAALDSEGEPEEPVSTE